MRLSCGCVVDCTLHANADLFAETLREYVRECDNPNATILSQAETQASFYRRAVMLLAKLEPNKPCPNCQRPVSLDAARCVGCGKRLVAPPVSYEPRDAYGPDDYKGWSL